MSKRDRATDRVRKQETAAAVLARERLPPPPCQRLVALNASLRADLDAGLHWRLVATRGTRRVCSAAPQHNMGRRQRSSMGPRLLRTEVRTMHAGRARSPPSSIGGMHAAPRGGSSARAGRAVGRPLAFGVASVLCKSLAVCFALRDSSRFEH